MAQFPQERSDLIPAFLIVYVLKHYSVRIFLEDKIKMRTKTPAVGIGVYDILGF